MKRLILLRKRLLQDPWGRGFLRLLSWVYGAATAIRRLLYQWRILPTKRLPAKTVCIGNLTTGGTGKTSAVLLAAETLRKHQVSVAILSRGYRRPKPTTDVQVLAGGSESAWIQAGDEPWMMHQVLKDYDVPILVAPNRYKAGLEAVHNFKSRILLLDDGFQHLRLHRDLNIVLISALDPFGGDHLLPLGELREPLKPGLRRANLIIITHANKVSAERLEEIRQILHKLRPHAPILEAVHQPDFLLDVKHEKKLPLDHISNRAVASFCAIGSPETFEGDLRRLGAKLRQVWRYPDHHVYSMQEMRSIDRVRGNMPVVTTLKDVPRLPMGWQQAISGEVLALAIRLDFIRGREIWESTFLKLKEPRWTPPPLPR
ncbi:MAG: tetraacyldisaccharide 4'-kinase [Elusimicrobia bacterium]|nr:tetraacyldisaccharide 4'-kinase [Elusimicrobiota bacterium]